MAKYDYWGYGDDENVGTPERISVRYVAFCNKAQFLRTLDDGRRGTLNWIRDRMAQTGNTQEVNLVNKYPGKMLKLKQPTYELLEVKDLVVSKNIKGVGNEKKKLKVS